MPIPVGKKSDKASKAKQRPAGDGQQEENVVRHTAPEGYDENEDLLTMEIPPPPEHIMDTESSTGERLMISHIMVENFKSYYGTQTIGPFHKNFTTVIGPNGSGKSNVIDALLFVFGCRASKIRSKNLSVLIHSSAGHEDIQSCTVAVNFQRIVDISRNEWRVIPGSQFFVSKTAFRDNASKYTLNGKAATLKEISITLRRCGIDLVHNRFLILQGEVEQISLMKPKAENDNEEGMLEYLEDIIGSSRLKLPINKLLYKLDGIHEQRAAQLLRLKYAEKERLALVEPVKEVVAILRLETAFSLVENKILCVKKLRITDALDEMAEGHEKCLQELSSAETLLQGQNEQNKKLKSEKKEMERVLERCQQELSKMQVELGTQNQKVFKSKNDIDRLKKREKKLGEDIVKKEKQIADLRDLPEQAKAKIETLKEALEIAEEQIRESTNFIEQKLGEIEEKTSSLKVQRKQIDAELARHSVTEDAVHSKLSLAQEELNFLQADEETQKKVLAELNEKLADLRQNLFVRTREYDDTQQALPDLTTEKARLEAECNSLRKGESALVDQIREIQCEIEESRQSAEQFRSSNRLLQSLMQQKQQGHIPGIYGRLGDLGAIDSKYDIAISTTCGALDNIVVDSVNTAQQCIEFLKRERLGIASFIALDKQQKLINYMKNKPQTPEDAPRLFDLIMVADEVVLPAFYYALSDTLVADDISIATRISMPESLGGKRWRVVTLKGEVVEVSGAMTGGGSTQRSGKIGRSVKVDTSKSAVDTAKDLSKLSQQLKEAEAKLTDLRQKLAKYNDDFRKNNEELNRINKLATDSKAEKNNLEKSVALIDEKVSAQAQKMKKSMADPVVLESAQFKVMGLKKESDEICRITDRLRAEFASLTEKIDNIEKQIVGAQKKKLHDAEGRKGDAEKAIAVEKSAIASNKRNLSKVEKCVADLEVDQEQTRENIQMEEAKLADSEARILELESLVNQHSEEIKQAEEALKNALERGKGLNTEELELQARLKLLNEKRQAVESKLKDLEHKIAVMDKDISKLPFYNLKDLDRLPEEVKNTSQLDEFLHNILFDEPGAPTAAGAMEWEDANERPPLSFSAMDVDEDTAVAGGGLHDYEVFPVGQKVTKMSFIGLEKLPKYKNEVIRRFDEELLERQASKLEELRSALKTKGVNMGLLDDYNGRVKIYDVESELFQQISRQRDLHREFCDELRKMRLQEFMEGFRKIGLALKEMYQMITMGGDASLDLVDSLDPFSEGISFGVRPPKKSWKQIVNLSGGEKTLASLAFVFGLHQYRPTPLYVMDEIDAALDYRNVSILAHLIKERTKNAQFIVISLRNNMFEKGDRLVGIYKVSDCTKNVVIDNDPRKYVAVD